MNQEVHVYLHPRFREDAHLLYGFATEEETALFKLDLSLWIDLSQLWLILLQMTMALSAIESKNITYLTKFPKIGKKQPNRWLWPSCRSWIQMQPAQSKAKVAEENQALKSHGSHVGILGQGNGNFQENQEILWRELDTVENYIKSALRCWWNRQSTNVVAGLNE